MKKILIQIYCNLLELYKTLMNDVWLMKYKKPIVKKDDETIQKIISDKCSICRFGDGEFSLILGESLKFQDYSSEIGKELLEILQLNDDEKNILICIPDIFDGLDQYVERAKKYWKNYLHRQRRQIYRILRPKKIYYNALISRFYVDYFDKFGMDEKVFRLKEIWNEKSILIVEGEKSRLGMGNDLFENTRRIQRIICPSQNAYERIDDIEKEMLQLEDYDLILIALGPTATVLAYRLACKGIQALDIGHIDIEYEWYLKGASEKEPVCHKYIGEMPGGDVVDDWVDDIYESQIVARISK